MKTEITDELLSFAHKVTLINTDSDYDDYICEDPEKGFCITTITYEYNEPHINYQTGWFKSKEEAIKELREMLR